LENSTRNGRAALALAATGAVFAALVWRFDWLCDDAFISFRYARNLARGLGLVYNPGESPRVEGYTNLLWVLALAPFERFGQLAPVVSRALSAACGIALFAWLGALVARRAGYDWRLTAAAMAFFAALPPVAAWSTSGLETMPFTLAVFGTFAGLAGARPRPVTSALCAAAAVLLRADGALFAGLALAAALLVAASTRSRPLARSALAACACAAIVVAGELLWRRAYYGVWAPNTARVKVDLTALVLARGGRYVAIFALTYLSVPLALATALALAARKREPVALGALAVVAGTFAYAVLVGGDFMAMGRFLVPALPFLALAFTAALARLAAFGRAGLACALALGAACAALSLSPAFGRDVLPRSAREPFHFRWSNEQFVTEHEQWRNMRRNSQIWSALGRALARHTRPGESLIIGTIGAVGYHCELAIHDPYGLVNREPFAESTPQERRSPGHARHVPLERFLAQRATYLEAAFVPRANPMQVQQARFGPTGKFWSMSKPEWYEVGDVPGAPEGFVLRLLRYAPP
jgi:hypothetical protein